MVIEHNLDVIKTADWIVDLGPEGGSGGGQIIATRTPEDVMAIKASYTGRFQENFTKLGTTEVLSCLAFIFILILALTEIPLTSQEALIALRSEFVDFYPQHIVVHTYQPVLHKLFNGYILAHKSTYSLHKGPIRAWLDQKA